MTQEEKQLLLKDICARLLYGVKCQVKIISFNEETDEHIELLDDEITFIEPDIYNVYLYKEGTDVDISDIKPYLRSMSSMTEDEQRTLNSMCNGVEMVSRLSGLKMFDKAFDWLNAHHFDYRGLIERGLALEAPAGMYKTESL